MRARNFCPVLTVLVVLLAGCGGESTPESEATSGAAARTAPVGAAPSLVPEPPSVTVQPSPFAPLTPTTAPSSTRTPPPVVHVASPRPHTTPPASTTPTPTAPPATATPTALPATATPILVPPTGTPTALPGTAGFSARPQSPTPSEAEMHFARGLDHYRDEQWDLAIAEFQEVTKLDTTLSLAFGLLGYSYANGPGDFEAAIAALETYLELDPEADDRAQVEADIATMRSILAAQKPLPNLEVPPGKALFVFLNYTTRDWNVDVGPHFMQVPARPAGEEYAMEIMPLDPGVYTWQAHSPGGGYTITDSNGNRSFEISVVEGEIVTHEVR